MKSVLKFLTAGCFGVALVFLFFHFNNSSERQDRNRAGGVVSDAMVKSRNPSGNLLPKQSIGTVADSVVEELEETPRPSGTIVIHRAADFQRGHFEHTMATDELQLSGDSLSGIYTSAEEKSVQPFDSIVLSYVATSPSGDKLIFDFRFRKENGEWSKWQEISAENLNRSVALESSARAWQYRFTFYRYQSGGGPKVSSVTVAIDNAENRAVSNYEAARATFASGDLKPE